MWLSKEQQIKAEENMGLVGKVIKDKVHGLGQAGMMEYDDLFQIGCVGLCKAAATDKGGGSFSTYAYRLIWNEICDALRHAQTRRCEQSVEDGALLNMEAPGSMEEDSRLESLFAVLEQRADGAAAKGIRALRFSIDGYRSGEIGRIMGAQPGTVRMWMTKGRRFLMEQPELKELVRTWAIPESN